MEYKKILKGVVDIINTTEKSDIGFANICSYIAENCPELKESEDESIRKWCISHFKECIRVTKDNDEYKKYLSNEVIPWLEKQGSEPNLCHHKVGKSESNDVLKCLINGIKFYYEYDAEARWGTEKFSMKVKDILSWLEKQEEHLENYDEAEKEKYDFVSGQFIECRKSFNEFKEDNSYWLEYIGNDTYIGRSDNILNKKFHITPRQLYRLFSQQHRPKEDSANEETNAPTGYGKYVDECLNEASKHFFSEGEDKYSVADLFYAGVRCGKSWLEKQGEKSSMTDEKIKEKAFKVYPETMSHDLSTGLMVDKNKDKRDGYIHALSEVMKEQGEQKSTNQVEPKFKIGDWITDGYLHCKIADVLEDRYIVDTKFVKRSAILFDNVSRYHLWTIQDAKPGDVIYLPNGNNEYYFFIFKGIENETVMSFAHFYQYNDGTSEVKGAIDKLSSVNDVFQPATKEQRDRLFQKIKEAGYKWDAEKLELKRISKEYPITPDKCIKPACSEDDELSCFESALFTAFSDAWQSYLLQSKVNVKQWAKEHSKELLEAAKEEFRKNEQTPAWSEEDETYSDHIITAIKSYYTDDKGKENPWREELLRWLKSLIPKNTWKPSKDI